MQGGQGELHQLLTLEAHSVSDPRRRRGPGPGIDRAADQGLPAAGERVVHPGLDQHHRPAPGERAARLGQRAIDRAGREGAPHRPRPLADAASVCTSLRMSLAAYADAVQLAAGRLVERAGTTRALGLLPIETWLTFTRSSETDVLAGVLDGLLFDAAAPDFSPADDAGGGRDRTTHRYCADGAAPAFDRRRDAPESAAATDREDLRAEAERVLAGRASVSIVEVVDDAGDWVTARRVLAELTAAHLHDELDYELVWSRRDADRSVGRDAVGDRGCRSGGWSDEHAGGCRERAQLQRAVVGEGAVRRAACRSTPDTPAVAGLTRAAEPDGSSIWMVPTLPDRCAGHARAGRARRCPGRRRAAERNGPRPRDLRRLLLAGPQRLGLARCRRHAHPDQSRVRRACAAGPNSRAT